MIFMEQPKLQSSSLIAHSSLLKALVNGNMSKLDAYAKSSVRLVRVIRFLSGFLVFGHIFTPPLCSESKFWDKIGKYSPKKVCRIIQVTLRYKGSLRKEHFYFLCSQHTTIYNVVSYLLQICFIKYTNILHVRIYKNIRIQFKGRSTIYI